VFAQAFQILRTKYGDIGKHFAFAFRFLAVDLSGLDVVVVVLFVPVAAKALTRRPNCFAVLACACIAPVHVESVLPRFLHLLLVCFELGLTHHFSAISIAHNLLVLNVGLHVPGSIRIHD
jgi:predicted branched-subunit amino acid permease